MTTLRETLARFEQPVDVDQIPWRLREARNAAEGHADGLRSRIRHAAADLAEAIRATKARAEEVAAVDKKTRGGMLGTLLASVNSESVEDLRAEAERKLAGDLAVLERSLEQARALIEQIPMLQADADYGAEVLANLQQRAVAGGLDRATVDDIARTGAAVAAVRGAVAGAAGPLFDPYDAGEAVAESAAATLGTLRSGRRAATVGEAMLDGVVDPDSGALGQYARRRAQQAAPGWVKDLDRDATEFDDAMAEIDGEREEARRRARREAEARRAAEAELDALDWDR